GLVELDVGAADRGTGGDAAAQADTVREADRQAVLGARRGRWHEAPPHRLAALAVQDLALGQIALGGGDHLGAVADRRPGRLAAQRGRGAAGTALEPDQMDPPPKPRDLSRR